MNKRLLLNLLMLAGVLALTAVVFYKPGIEPPAELPPLTTLNSAQVQRIDIIRADATLTLERRDGIWWVAGDKPVTADPVQMETLLQLPGATPVRSYAASELDLAQLKLAPPQTTLRLDTTELQFGATDPLQGLRYVKIGATVHMIGDRYQNILQGKRTQFASRRLLPEKADIVAIELPKLKIAKQPEGSWTIEPTPEKISADAVQQLVQSWINASALWVRDYQKAQDSKPVTVRLADGQRIDFELHQSEGETLLARPDLGLQYQLPEESAKPLLELEQPAAEPAQ